MAALEREAVELAPFPRRERARRRRLALLALGVLDRPVRAGELREPLGEDLEEALLDAAELGLCSGSNGAYLGAPHAGLELGFLLLGSHESSSAVRALLPLVTDETRRMLLAIAADPLGEGRAAARARKRDGASAALLSALDGDGPVELELTGPHARLRCIALSSAAYLLLSSQPGASEALLGSALGKVLEGGKLRASQALPVAVAVQALFDLGRRDEALLLAQRGQVELDDDASAACRLMLSALEGNLRVSRGQIAEARQCFTRVELSARALGLEEFVGIARIAFGTVALQEGGADAAERLYRSALQLCAGTLRFERLALHCLGNVFLQTGRIAAARAAFDATLEHLDSPGLRLAGYVSAASADAFLGDAASARARVVTLKSFASSSRRQKLVVLLSEAWARIAERRLDEALKLLASVELEASAEKQPAHAVSVAWLQARCLAWLERWPEAETALSRAGRLHHQHRLSSHHAAIHLLDAELAVAGGDPSRARRALRRLQEVPLGARALDFAFRARVLEWGLARGEKNAGALESARQRVGAEWDALLAQVPPEGVRAFSEALDRPALLAQLGKAAPLASDVPLLLGRSEPFRAMLSRLKKVAGADVSVLLTGETGVGKELVARALHALSPRRDRPFIALNCAALTDELLLSELFGHEKGAFTGAVERSIGHFERADGGTLFLDEVADMSPRGQAALLRALQERSFERVGGGKLLRADVRILAATNADLSRAVRAKEFREDLYFRLKGIHLEIPALRQRGDDVLTLSAHFLEQAAGLRGSGPKRFSTEAEQLLIAYAWPGNVRELKNVVGAVELLSDGPVVTAELLRPLIAVPPSGGSHGAEIGAADFERSGLTLTEYLTRLRRDCIAEALNRNAGSIAAAAAQLGFSRSRLSQIVHDDKQLKPLAGRARKGR